MAAFSFQAAHPANTKWHCVTAYCTWTYHTGNREKWGCTGTHPRPCRALKPQCTWTSTHNTVSHSTLNLLQSCLCASCVVLLAHSLCRAPLKPGPSPPSLFWGGKGRELQPSAASDVLQSVSLAAGRGGNMHWVPTPFHSSQGTAPDHANKASAQREASSLSAERSLFSAAPDSQSYWCWQALLEVSTPSPCSSRVSWNRLPRNMSSWIFDFPRTKTPQCPWKPVPGVDHPHSQNPPLAHLYLPRVRCWKPCGCSSVTPLLQWFTQFIECQSLNQS